MTALTLSPPQTNTSLLCSEFTEPYARHPDPALAGIRTRWELITPEVAQCYLDRMGRNRPHSLGLELRYTADLLNGKWPITHQGVGFNVKGELIDRRHTLKAIIRSKVSVWMLVTYGLSMEAMAATDKGRPRSPAASLAIAGHEFTTDRLVAVARKMFDGPGSKNGGKWLTADQIGSFMQCHADAIRFVEAQVPSSLAPATVAAVIGRAFHHVEPEVLERFLLAMSDKVPKGEEQDGDRSARALKDAIASSRGVGTSAKVQNALYCKAQEALVLFRRQEDRLRLRGSYDTDVFPLPKGTERPFLTAADAPPAESAPAESA